MQWKKESGLTSQSLTKNKLEQMRKDHFYSLFEKQYGDLPVGGFLNPEIVEETDNFLIFKCHYDNFESDEDIWHYGFNLATRQFYAA